MPAQRHYPQRVDVAIVGSGPTAAAYARILSESAPEARIAMFEVGPTVSSPPGAHVKSIPEGADRARAQRASEGPGADAPKITSPAAMKSGKRLARPGTFLIEGEHTVPGEDGLPVAAMSSNVGGMGAHWTGACPRPGDSERITFLDDLDEILDDAERLLGVSRTAFENAPFGSVIVERLGAAVNAGRPPERRVQAMPLAVHRQGDGSLVWSGPDVIMGEATRSNPNFELFDESLVTKVLTADGRASGVEVRDLRTDSTHTVDARFVIVGADAFRTPQLLWASGIRPDALGRYLNDQTQVVFSSRLRDVSAPVVADETAGGLKVQSGVNWVPFTDALPFHIQVMQPDSSPVPVPEDDPLVPGSIVGLGMFLAKDLQHEDRVEFSDVDVDSYGMPAIRVHYRLTERDHEMLERARAAAIELAEAVGEPFDDTPFTLPLGSSLHYQGTTRMGDQDDGTSVCDTHSEVWDAPGVFVAGNNVIPTATACNPTLTSVALAIRGARHVAARLADAGSAVRNS
ncbi:MAG TPA: GMC oxidoreductase [Microbacterium sp.]|uniref:GMC oxidoreductase n=1 Tax=Microbacterium sp. TaxID=51671 RepID=UPI002B786191|nr:GMC oxidoreductase [Microbacterium sp.]HWI30750.1 GMC oxidoreductase [Microbacterium sp.]